MPPPQRAAKTGAAYPGSKANARPHSNAWLAASPLMPSMKFQAFTRPRASTKLAAQAIAAAPARMHGGGKHACRECVHPEPRPGRQGLVIVQPTDAGHQCQARSNQPQRSDCRPPATPSTPGTAGLQSRCRCRRRAGFPPGGCDARQADRSNHAVAHDPRPTQCPARTRPRRPNRPRATPSDQTTA